MSRGVEPADHKVSRRRVADSTGARKYLVEGYIIQRYYKTKVLLTKVLFGQRYYRTKVLSGTKSDQYLKNLIYLRYFNKLKTS